MTISPRQCSAAWCVSFRRHCHHLTLAVAAEAHRPGLTVDQYLVGLLIILPVAGFWAIAERESRWGTAVLLLAAVGLGIMVGRILQLWNGHP